MDEQTSNRLNPLKRWAAIRAALRGDALVKQNDATQAIQVIEDKVPVRPVIPRIAQPPNMDQIPLDWSAVYLGPGRPPMPMWNQGYWDGRRRVENIDPRSIEYPPNVNATIQPRIGYGLMPFADIEMYAHVPPVAKCRRMIIDEIKSLEPKIMNSDGEVVDDPDLRWMTTYPDRVRPWASWISRFLYNSIVFDAPAVQPIYSTDGKIMAVKVIEGPTIFVMVNEHGDQPAPPAPAFAQIIWGTQFIWLTSDQLWYYPRNLGAHTPYGVPAIEEVIQPIQTVANMWNYSLAWYTEGTTPEDSMAMPPDWTVDQVREYQAFEDAELAGNATLRRRRRYYPNGVSILAQKNATFDEKTYNAAVDEISLMHGIPPAEFGKMPGQGLGGKGMSQNKTTQFFRLAIEPNIQPVVDLCNRILRFNGYEGYHLEMNYPTTSIDPTEEHQNVLDEFEAGVTQRDEARGKLGYTKLGGEIGSFVVDPSPKGATEDGAAQGSKVKVKSPNGSAVAVNADKVPVHNRVKVKDSNLNDSKVIVKAEEVTHSEDGGMIALFPPDDISERLAAIVKAAGLPDSARLEAAANLHVSLAVFSDEIAKGTRVLAAMQIVALGCPWDALIGRIGGYGVFANGDEKVIYASLDAPELPALRQALCDQLDQLGIEYAKDHGFTPHITLAYIPAEAEFGGIDVPEMDVAIDGLTLARGELDKVTITFREGYTRMGKVISNEPLRKNGQSDSATVATPDPSRHQAEKVESIFDALGVWPVARFVPADESDRPSQVVNDPLLKHCGVCPDDDQYFGMPISRAMTVDMPHQGANGSEVVAISPPKELGLPPVPALWKPAAKEDQGLNENIGGPQYLREEAAWLVDQALTDDDHHLVPLAYVIDLDGEDGSVLYYSRDHDDAQDTSAYGPEWIELAAVLDFIIGQTDRGMHNWLTHPDDPKRPLLIDNGLAFPAPGSPRQIVSAFIEAQGDKPISSEVLQAVALLCGDKSLWHDLETMLGKNAALMGQQRACELRDHGAISVSSETAETSTT
jgi:2'-5' RNA ligase